MTHDMSSHNKRHVSTVIVVPLLCLLLSPRVSAGLLSVTENCFKRGIKPELFSLSLVCVKGHYPFMTCHSESVINNVVSYTTAQKQVGLVKPMTQ